MRWNRGRGRGDVDPGVAREASAVRDARQLLFTPPPTAPAAPAEATAPVPGTPARETAFARRHVETMVAQFYRLVLGREPDAKGLYDHADALHQDGTLAGVATLLRHMLHSEEGRSVAARLALDDALRREVTPVFGPVHHVASLGSSPQAVLLLRQCGLRRWSGPLDWVAADPAAVAHCLEDDFATLLDEREVTAVAPGRSSTHARYQGPGAGPVFPMADLTRPEARSHHRRAVERFRRLLGAPGRKLFLSMLSDTASRDDATLLADHERLDRALAARTEDFRLLTVAHDGVRAGAATGLRELPVSGRGGLFRFRSAAAPDAEAGFAGVWDSLVLRRLLWTCSYDLQDEP